MKVKSQSENIVHCDPKADEPNLCGLPAKISLGSTNLACLSLRTRPS